MSKVLVFTAGTGTKSGGAFTELLGQNIQMATQLFPDGIRAIVRPTSDVSRLKSAIPMVECYAGALENVDFLKTAMGEADTVLHIAGIHWSREIVSAAAACGVRRLILVHTTGIYSKYKQAGEEYRKIDEFVYKTCTDNDIRLTILRPTMIYGNVTDHNVVTFIKMVDRLPVMPVVNGAHYELQPVHYKDLAKAYYDVLTHEEETANRDFDLSGGEPIELREMLRGIGKGLGKRVRFVSCPYPIAYGGACMVYGLTLTKKDYREKVQRLCEPRVYSHQAAKDAFGYQPVSFAEGVQDEIREYLDLKKK